MSKQKRIYSKEFKLEAIQLLESQGGNTSAVARDMSVELNLLNHWIREYKADKKHAFPGLGKLKEPEEEICQLRKVLADTKMERDILKKTWAFSQNRPIKVPVYQRLSGSISGRENVSSF